MSSNIVLITEENKMNLKGIEALLSNDGYRVVWVKENGMEVLKKNEQVHPAAILMNTFMPGMDALGVLKILKSQPEAPYCFVFGTFDSTHIIQKVMKNGAEYYFYLPMDVKIIAERIIDMMDNQSEHEEALLHINETDTANATKNNPDLATILTDVMHQLGIPAHIKGYQYLRIGIMMALNDRGLLEAVTKELYPEIAKQTGSTASRVERAIRHAIEVAWNRGDIKAQERIFGYTINTLKGKPTNSEFIAMMVDTLYQKYQREAS